MKNAETARGAVGVSLLAAMLLASGCASISENTHAYLGSPQCAPVAAEKVEIFPTQPKVPMVQLGEIVLATDANPPRAKLEEKLRKAGGKLGADGVFIASDQTHIYPILYWDAWGPGSGEDWHRIVVGVAFKRIGK